MPPCSPRGSSLQACFSPAWRFRSGESTSTSWRPTARFWARALCDGPSSLPTVVVPLHGSRASGSATRWPAVRRSRGALLPAAPPRATERRRSPRCRPGSWATPSRDGTTPRLPPRSSWSGATTGGCGSSRCCCPVRWSRLAEWAWPARSGDGDGRRSGVRCPPDSPISLIRSPPGRGRRLSIRGFRPVMTW